MGRHRKSSPKKKATKSGKVKKIKKEKIDGLSPDDLKRLRSHTRKVWQWSHPWRLAKARARGADGFDYCENKNCERKGKPVPKVFVDHIKPVGDVCGPNYIKWLFIPSKGLQCWCKPCHDKKTKEEKNAEKKIKKFTDGF